MTKLNPKSIIPGTITTEMLSPEVQNKLETSSGGSNVSYTPQELTEEQKEIARNNIDSQKNLTVELKANGNIVLGGIEGGDKEFMPSTPSGHPLHDSFMLTGGVWTPYDQLPDRLKDERSLANGGYWSYRVSEGGLEDITTEEFAKAYAFEPILTKKIPVAYQWAANAYTDTPRFNICKSHGTSTYSYTRVSQGLNSINADKMEVLFLSGGIYVNASDISYMLYNNTSIKRICHSRFGISGCKTANSVKDAFKNCVSLEEISLIGLITNLDISHSPKLSNKSILTTVTSENATTQIVLTLHADAYARAMADHEIVAALEAHTNISLASA